MNDREQEIVAFIDELLVTGDRLSKIVFRAYKNDPNSGVFVVGGYPEYPAPETDYFQWDTDCNILISMLGDAGKHFGKQFSGSTYSSATVYDNLVPKKLGNLNAIKTAIQKGRIQVGSQTTNEDTMHQFRQGFEMLFKQFSGQIVVYKNYGTPAQTEVQMRANKNRKNKQRDEFQFLERCDIQHGDVIKQSSSHDLWVVDETEDHVVGDTFVCFNVFVTRADAVGAARSQPAPSNAVHVTGPVYGGIQIGSHGSTQQIHVKVDHRYEESMQHLRRAVNDSDLSDLDKEEVSHSLDRVDQLAKREQTPETKLKITEKLAVVSSMIAISQGLAVIAMPYIETIQRLFH
jgi:hypothetical protein